MLDNNADYALGRLTVPPPDRRGVSITLRRARTNGALFPALFFCGFIQAFDLSLCLPRPLSHNALASSDAFTTWHFRPLVHGGFDFYAVGRRQDPRVARARVPAWRSAVRWRVFGERISLTLTAPKQYRFGN